MHRETGKEQEVEVLYGEGVAGGAGPEPCVPDREVSIEASAGVRIGQDIEPRKKDYPGCRRRSLSGRQHGRAPRSRGPSRPGVVEDLGMCARSLYGNRESS